MSASNGVIRIGRKGIKQFAFGEDGQPGSEPFKVDVVTAFDKWIEIDNNFRPEEADEDGNRLIPRSELPAYHQATIDFVESLRGNNRTSSMPEGYEEVNISEALHFIARLREEYNELADFFRPRSRQKPEQQDTSEVELRFSPEGEPAKS